jgi:hypothetical protein
MNKIDHFVDSTLKVTASEDLNIEKDLAAQNVDNKTIEELLEDDNDKTKKE